MNRILALLIIIIAGCGLAATKPSPAHTKEIELNLMGDTAYASGDYGGAISYYGSALKVAESIENIDGMAVNILSLAVVLRETGDYEAAIARLDLMLEAEHVEYPAGRLSEAAYLKALTLADLRRDEAAEKLSDQALALCGGSCPAKGRILNLKARLALARKDTGSAQRLAEEALTANRRRNGYPAEEANSLRLMAEIAVNGGEAARARGLYEKALSVDKRLGLSKKIAEDLLGLAWMYAMQSDTDRARGHATRALAVSESAGYAEGVRKANALLDRLPAISAE